MKDRRTVEGIAIYFVATREPLEGGGGGREGEEGVMLSWKWISALKNKHVFRGIFSKLKSYLIPSSF